MSKVAVIVGVGKGIGGSVALKFAKEGFSVAILGRSITGDDSDEKVQLRKELEKLGGKVMPVACDATDESSVKSAFDKIKAELGDPDVLVYNAGAAKFGQKIMEAKADEFVSYFKGNCLGGLLTAQQVIPGMIKKQAGTIIFTGATASVRGMAGTASIATGKFALRALSQSMAREFSQQGIHVAHVIIDGPVDLPSTRKYLPDKPSEFFLNPVEIANQYWNLHTQHKSVWSQEIDLRPHAETNMYIH
eukprot:TRINITY_DN4431_c0_g1_i1.p1 TRINITY_DN4431_c0_g1~~TRINITY_DN4431_c0_g1_i1.p1  ORF type:complete len:247 (+),score=89.00 TRINITY_DN4431_c0_g1_i1:66-806(+)